MFFFKPSLKVTKMYVWICWIINQGNWDCQGERVIDSFIQICWDQSCRASVMHDYMWLEQANLSEPELYAALHINFNQYKLWNYGNHLFIKGLKGIRVQGVRRR